MARFITLSLALMLGCGPTTPPPSNANQTPEPAAATSGATYDVHEWGLAATLLQGPAIQLHTIPGLTVSPPISTRAPILYVHRHGAGPLTLSATVQIPSGNITEHWPLTEPVERGVRWAEVQVGDASCEGAHYPAPTSPTCAGVADNHCEAARLGDLEANDASCLTVGGEPYNHLFYRGALGAASLPFEMQRDPTTGDVTIQHRGTSPAVGDVIRVFAGSNPPWVAMAPAPAPGRSVVLAVPRTADEVDAAHRSVSRGLRELGMTEPEAEAFERAWMPQLFGLGASTTARDLERNPNRGLRSSPPEAEFILYWLPEADASQLATLSFDPPPREVRRAFLVRVVL